MADAVAGARLPWIISGMSIHIKADAPPERQTPFTRLRDESERILKENGHDGWTHGETFVRGRRIQLRELDAVMADLLVDGELRVRDFTASTKWLEEFRNVLTAL